MGGIRTAELVEVHPGWDVGNKPIVQDDLGECQGYMSYYSLAKWEKHAEAAGTGGKRTR